MGKDKDSLDPRKRTHQEHNLYIPYIIERRYRYLGEAYVYNYLTDSYLSLDIYAAKKFTTESEAKAYLKKRRLVGQGGWKVKKI